MGVFAKTIKQILCKHRMLAALKPCSKRNFTISYSYPLNEILCHIRHPVIIPTWRQFSCTSAKYTTQARQSIEDIECAPDSATYQNETLWLYDIMKSSECYQKYMVTPIISTQTVSDAEVEAIIKQDWSDANILDILKATKKLAYHAINTNGRFQNDSYDFLLKAFTNNMDSATTDDFIMFLKYLIPLKKNMDAKVFEKFMWKIDTTLRVQVSSRKLTDLLIFCDLIFNLGAGANDFKKFAVTRLSSKMKKLNIKQFAQLLFYISIFGKGATNMYEVECRLEQYIDVISMSDLAIVLRGFFRNRTPLMSGTLHAKIIKKLIASLPEIDSVCLGIIFKTMRMDLKHTNLTLLKSLMQAIIPHIPNLSYFCLINFLHMLVTVSMYEEETFQKCHERIQSEIHNMRLKDIERHCLTLVAICPETNNHPLYHNVINEFLNTYKGRRRSEIEKYPHVFVTTLKNLSFKDIYNEELIDYIYSTEFRQLLRAWNIHHLPYTSDYWTLHCNVLVDRPEYTGNLLPDDLYWKISSKYCNSKVSTKQQSKKSATYMEYLSHIQEYVGVKNVYCGMILPQYLSEDLVIGVDKEKKFVAASDIFPTMPAGSIIRPDTDEMRDIEWLVLCLVSENHVVRGTNKYVGVVESKFRQLKAIGYTPIPLAYYKWQQNAPVDYKTIIQSAIKKAVESL